VQLIDLSHTVTDGMETYPGLPGPTISDHLSRAASRERYAPGTEFQIGRIDMVANTGTYLDTPAHRYADGYDLSALPLERVALVPGALVDAIGTPIGAEVFNGLDLEGRAVLVRTGWDQHWGTAAYGGGAHPYLTAAAATALIDARVALVGIDSVNIDATTTGEWPVHSALLAEGHSHRRALARPRPTAARPPLHLHRRAREGRWHGHVSGADLRRTRRVSEAKHASVSQSFQTRSLIGVRGQGRMTRVATGRKKCACSSAYQRGEGKA
jgi:arylformamidase